MDENLKNKHCKACEEGEKPLSTHDEEEMAGNITDWEINRQGTHKLLKTVKAQTFMDAVTLIGT